MATLLFSSVKMLQVNFKRRMGVVVNVSESLSHTTISWDIHIQWLQRMVWRSIVVQQWLVFAKSGSLFLKSTQKLSESTHQMMLLGRQKLKRVTAQILNAQDWAPMIGPSLKPCSSSQSEDPIDLALFLHYYWTLRRFFGQNLTPKQMLKSQNVAYRSEIGDIFSYCKNCTNLNGALYIH